MRLLLLIFFSISFISLKAQVPLPFNGMHHTQRVPFSDYRQFSDSNNVKKKWFLSRYANISTSYSFFSGGSAAILSAPLGIQLNRRLNNNLYAFAGVSIAPAYINFSRSFNDPGLNKFYPVSSHYTSNSLAIYSRVEGGLMYINNDKTFSISGSVNIDRGSYPLYSSYRNNPKRQPPVVAPRQWSFHRYGDDQLLFPDLPGITKYTPSFLWLNQGYNHQ